MRAKKFEIMPGEGIEPSRELPPRGDFNADPCGDVRHGRSIYAAGLRFRRRAAYATGSYRCAVGTRLGPIAGILKVNKLLRTLQAEAVNGKNLLGFRSPWVAESCSPFPRNRERIGKAPCVRMVRRSTGGEPRIVPGGCQRGRRGCRLRSARGHAQPRAREGDQRHRSRDPGGGRSETVDSIRRRPLASAKGSFDSKTRSSNNSAPN
jgi:hypothetical protein